MPRRSATSFLPKKFVSEPPLVRMARIGDLARGTVFLISGAFALLAALGAGKHPKA